MTEKLRSTQVNKALHKLFGDVSTVAQEKGLERRTILNDLEGYSCPIDPTFIKEVWRMIQFTQTGKTSTAQLTNSEVSRVYDTFNLFLGESYGIHLPWPSVEQMFLAGLDNEKFQ